MTNDLFSRGVSALMEKQNLNRAELSRKAGFRETSTVLRDMFKRGSMPSIDKAKAIASALGVRLDDVFLAGKGIFSDNLKSDFTPTVPRYDLRLSAGAGAFNSEGDPLDYIPFTQEFITKKLKRINTKDLVCAEIDGHSMEPTMSDDDLVIIDRSAKDIGKGIYAVHYDGAAYAKRIEKSGQDLLLVPDNPRHPTWTVENGDARGFEVIGKIIWVGRGLE